MLLLNTSVPLLPMKIVTAVVIVVKLLTTGDLNHDDQI